MDLSRKVEVRLKPEDEYCHPVEAAENFNESMYINCFDHKKKLGGWFRVGNRPNEGYAEMSCCIYLPDGRVGFMFKRPEISGNEELNAGGMRFHVSEPFKKLEVDQRMFFGGSFIGIIDPGKVFGPGWCLLISAGKNVLTCLSRECAGSCQENRPYQ